MSRHVRLAEGLRRKNVWVAVKVQKPDVSKQVEWDLAGYRATMWIYEKFLFDMPIYFLAGKCRK